MKKVIFLVPSLKMGGMERVCVNYANLFNRRGYEVTVLNFTSDEEAIVSGFDKEIKYIKSYVPVPNILRAGLKNILKFNFRILSWEKWVKFHSSKYLYKNYIKDNYDVEVAFFGVASMKIVSGSTNKNAKKLAWIHYSNVEDDIKSIGSFKKANKIYNSLEKIICVADKPVDKIKQLFNRTTNVYVVNNPQDSKRILNLSKETFCEKKDKFTFINVSRIVEKEKGFIRLLEVCKKLKNCGFDFDFWIVGDGYDKKRIEDRARELKLDNVKFFGLQTNPYKYIKNADMYVCSSYTEGFSMVMMETVILGVPMISTDVSGAKEMLGDSEYGLVVENSESGLFDGMKKILSDKELYNHYVEMADKRKDYLSEDKIMDYVEAIINN